MGTNLNPVDAKKIYNRVWDELEKRYPLTKKNEEDVFSYSETRYFLPELFPPPWNAIVIEYNGFDEGKLFYLEDYDSIDALMKDILQEIEKG